MRYNDTKTSRYISYVLRHNPQDINKELRKDGYMLVKDLLEGMNNKKYDITLEDLDRIVKEDNKQRYSYSSDKLMIRANQGHSINVDVDLKEIIPPNILYHGTCTRVKDIILKQGIKKMNRQYVHLSKDIETATKVGKRHGELLIFKIDCDRMVKDGIKFYISENGVYLTDYVDKKYIEILEVRDE